MGSLIPGLIDDLGRECLIRIPLMSIPTAASVGKTWNFEINSSEFRQLRKRAGLARPVMVLAQADPVENTGQGLKDDQMLTVYNTKPTPGYRLVLCDPQTGSWGCLPGLPQGLPVFSGVVDVGLDLVVVGGLDPVTCRASNTVYVYNFLSGKWRRGSDMPGVKRSFFGCGSDHNGIVVVAGGHDEDKNALKSALLYDVANDMWVPLPDMAKERDECKVLFHSGKFHVISGYSTDTQGRFERTAQVFDLATWRWDSVVDDFLEAGGTPSSCVTGSDGRVYACVGRRSADVAVQRGDRWQVVAKVPADVRSSHWMSSLGDKLVVIGCRSIGEPNNCYMLDVKDYKWSKINVPNEFCGLVQTGCVMEI